MTEYKVCQHAIEEQVSVLHIDKDTWNNITDDELQNVVHKWLHTIDFKCYMTVEHKDCQIHYNYDTKTEKICITDNGVKVLFKAYKITYYYDICERKYRGLKRK